MERKEIVAEALAGCSVKTLEAAGINWRLCSDATLLARRERRSHRWLAKLSGYEPNYAVTVLRRYGVAWKTAPEEQIKSAIEDAVRRGRETLTRKCSPIEHNGRWYTVDEFAALVDLPAKLLRRRRVALRSWAVVASETIARPGKWHDPPRYGSPSRSGGRPSPLLTIDGETRTQRQWIADLGLDRRTPWKAAKKAGHSTADEITARVRARRSDAAHAPASVASVQTTRMVRGDRSVSACAASGRGANDSKEVAA